RDKLVTGVQTCALPISDFTIDWTVRNVDLTLRGQQRIDEIADLGGGGGFWKGKRRREELVTQALVALHCYVRDEQYLVGDDQKRSEERRVGKEEGGWWR